MRGKGGGKDSTIVLAGITPAYAGKSYRRISADPIHQDHPRLCGEKLLVYTPKTPYVGSPPPMRGKELFPVVSVRRLRITPAYAGKRDVSRMSFPMYEDHPRLCGEKVYSMASVE